MKANKNLIFSMAFVQILTYSSNNPFTLHRNTIFKTDLIHFIAE